MPRPRLRLKDSGEVISVATTPDSVSSIRPTIAVSVVAMIGIISEMAREAAARARRGDVLASRDPRCMGGGGRNKVTLELV